MGETSPFPQTTQLTHFLGLCLKPPQKKTASKVTAGCSQQTPLLVLRVGGRPAFPAVTAALWALQDGAATVGALYPVRVHSASRRPGGSPLIPTHRRYIVSSSLLCSVGWGSPCSLGERALQPQICLLFWLPLQLCEKASPSLSQPLLGSLGSIFCTPQSQCCISARFQLMVHVDCLEVQLYMQFGSRSKWHSYNSSVAIFGPRSL